MKRLLISLLTMALMVGVGASTYLAQSAPPTITIGVVSYQYEANAIPLGMLMPILEQDMAVLPAPDTANRGTDTDSYKSSPGTRVLFTGKEADTAEAQVAAIDALIAEGVKGIILAPVGDTDTVRIAVNRALLAKIPVVIVHRPIPGLEGNLTAYVGLEPFSVGVGWAKGSVGTSSGGTVGSSPGRPFYVIVSDLNDPRQGLLVQGLEAKGVGAYQGVLQVAPQNAFGEVQKIIAADKAPLINHLIVADPALVSEVARAAQELTAGTDRLVKVGVFGMPADFNQLFAAKALHMVTTEDHYDMFQRAALELKMFNVASERLETQYIPAQIHGGLTSRNYMNYPYDYDRTITFTFHRFWR